MTDEESESTERSTLGHGHSYFVPMVDMLAGVVFILVILLAATTLVSRNEFVSAEVKQTGKEKSTTISTAANAAQQQAIDGTTARVLQERADEAEATALSHKRNAEIAVDFLLKRLASGLRKQGYDVTTSVSDATLRVLKVDSFLSGKALLSSSGELLASDLSAILDQELPCLTASATSARSCVGYPLAALKAVKIEARSDAGLDDRTKDIQSFVMMSKIISLHPSLIELRSASGVGIFTYNAGVSKPANSGVDGGIELRFRF